MARAGLSLRLLSSRAATWTTCGAASGALPRRPSLPITLQEIRQHLCESEGPSERVAPILQMGKLRASQRTWPRVDSARVRQKHSSASHEFGLCGTLVTAELKLDQHLGNMTDKGPQGLEGEYVGLSTLILPLVTHTPSSVPLRGPSYPASTPTWQCRLWWRLLTVYLSACQGIRNPVRLYPEGLSKGPGNDKTLASHSARSCIQERAGK